VEYKYKKFLTQDLVMQTTTELGREIRAFYDPARTNAR
jgi:hypothetical protein